MINKIKEILAEEGFTLHSNSGDNTYFYFTDDKGLGIQVILSGEQQTFKVLCNIGTCMHIEYAELSIKFLLNKSEALELALSRMDRLNGSRVVKNMRQEFIEYRYKN